MKSFARAWLRLRIALLELQIDAGRQSIAWRAELLERQRKALAAARQELEGRHQPTVYQLGGR